MMSWSERVLRIALCKEQGSSEDTVRLAEDLMMARAALCKVQDLVEGAGDESAFDFIKELFDKMEIRK